MPFTVYTFQWLMHTVMDESYTYNVFECRQYVYH